MDAVEISGVFSNRRRSSLTNWDDFVNGILGFRMDISDRQLFYLYLSDLYEYNNTNSNYDAIKKKFFKTK